jgi:hypothetical protein
MIKPKLPPFHTILGIILTVLVCGYFVASWAQHMLSPETQANLKRWDREGDKR